MFAIYTYVVFYHAQYIMTVTMFYCMDTKTSSSLIIDRKQRQSSKYYVGENKIIPPPVSYTKDEDTGYDEVKGIQSHT